MMSDRQYQTQYQVLDQRPQYDQQTPSLHHSGGEDGGGLSSSGDSHGSPGLLLHTVPDRTRRWNHIDDLDTFFRRVYRFHQSSGYTIMMLGEWVGIMKYMFIVCLTVFVTCFLNYDLLFGNESIHLSSNNETAEIIKISLVDGIYSYSMAMSRMHRSMKLVLTAAIIFLMFRIGYSLYNAYHFWQTREFFINALKIEDGGLQDVTWDEVKRQLMEVQLQQRMCVHKDILTSLDIYQRILRCQNYMVALVNQNIIPVRFYLPFWGELIFLTRGYEFNIYTLLFWGPYSLLSTVNIEQLRRPDVKKEVIRKLEKHILYLSIINFVCMPFIFIYQLLYALYHNAVRVKNEPGSLAGRSWSQYGRLYLRHYNELDHELVARLNRAYKPSMAYLGSFSSPGVAVVANAIQFMASAICAVFILLSVYDDDFLRVEHVINLIAASLAIVAVTKAFIPDENLVWVPELLMERIVAHIHYLPESWTDKIHTSQVRDEFSQLFQFKFMHLIEELLSPVLTPFILFFSLRYRAKNIVEFFQMFTVEVEGIGNVCSFAQMNIQQHGSPSWQPQQTGGGGRGGASETGAAPDGGRTELSLVHFAYTNPDWQPPKAGAAFLNAIKNRATRYDNTALATVAENQYDHSLNSLNLTAVEKIHPLMRPSGAAVTTAGGNVNSMHESNYTVRGFNGSVTRLEGPLQTSGGTTHRSVYDESVTQTGMTASIHSRLPSLGDPTLQLPVTQNALDMERSCLYLRDLNNQRRQFGADYDPATNQQRQQEFRQQAHQQDKYRQQRDQGQHLYQHSEQLSQPGGSSGSGHGRYDDTVGDDNSPAISAFTYHQHPAFAGLDGRNNDVSFAASRVYQRTPSPPPLDPFADTSLMSQSNITSVQSDAISSRYQDLLHGASDLLTRQGAEQVPPLPPLMHEGAEQVPPLPPLEQPAPFSSSHSSTSTNKRHEKDSLLPSRPR